MNQVIIQKKLESINLIATNGTFVTKGEIESNFLTTLTNEPKLNHWVKTILNQIVIKFEPPKGVFKMLLYISPVFSKLLKSDLNLLFLIKHHSEEKGENFIKMIQNSHWQETCEKKCYLLFLSKFISTCIFDLLKKEDISNFNEISVKKEDFFFVEYLFSPSFDVLHSSPIVSMGHTVLIVQDLLLYCTKKISETRNQFCPLSLRG